MSSRRFASLVGRNEYEPDDFYDEAHEDFNDRFDETSRAYEEDGQVQTAYDRDDDREQAESSFHDEYGNGDPLTIHDIGGDAEAWGERERSGSRSRATGDVRRRISAHKLRSTGKRDSDEAPSAPPSVEMFDNLAVILERVSDRVSDDVFTSLRDSLRNIAGYVVNLEKSVQDREIDSELNAMRGTLHSSRRVNRFFNDSPSVVQAHINTLEKQLVAKSNDVDRVVAHYKQIQNDSASKIHALQAQLSSLHKQHKQTEKESEENFQQLCTKEAELQIALVHLHTAQDELKKLLNDKAQNFKMKREATKELNDMLEKHSRYSTKQFNALSAQLNAMREELFREKSLRQKDLHDFQQQSAQQTEKIFMLETISKQLNARIAHMTRNFNSGGSVAGQNEFQSPHMTRARSGSSLSRVSNSFADLQDALGGYRPELGHGQSEFRRTPSREQHTTAARDKSEFSLLPSSKSRLIREDPQKSTTRSSTPSSLTAARRTNPQGTQPRNTKPLNDNTMLSRNGFAADSVATANTRPPRAVDSARRESLPLARQSLLQEDDSPSDKVIINESSSSSRSNNNNNNNNSNNNSLDKRQEETSTMAKAQEPPPPVQTKAPVLATPPRTIDDLLANSRTPKTIRGGGSARNTPKPE